MKNLFIITVILIAGAARANQSSADIQAILTDSNFQNVVGEEEIISVTNSGQRSYSFVFGRCSIQVSVLSTCAPTPGGPCKTEVRFDSSSVSCLPQ